MEDIRRNFLKNQTSPITAVKIFSQNAEFISFFTKMLDSFFNVVFLCLTSGMSSIASFRNFEAALSAVGFTMVLDKVERRFTAF